MKLISKILCAVAILVLVPVTALSDEAPPTQQVLSQEIILSPVEYVDKYASQYQIDASVLKKVMWCESSNNPNAVGDHGLAKNVMQFHKTTFDSYSDKLGESLDYDSYKDQIKLAAYMFSIGQEKHWTCYSKIIGK